MQMKHLIIFALVGMVALFGFNLINGNQREKNRELIVSNATSEQTLSTVVPDTDNVENSSTDIVNQPLGKQPKAILDKATTQIEQAQQADKQRLEQTGSAE